MPFTANRGTFPAMLPRYPFLEGFGLLRKPSIFARRRTHQEFIHLIVSNFFQQLICHYPHIHLRILLPSLYHTRPRNNKGRGSLPSTALATLLRKATLRVGGYDLMSHSIRSARGFTTTFRGVSRYLISAAVRPDLVYCFCILDQDSSRSIFPHSHDSQSPSAYALNFFNGRMN